MTLDEEIAHGKAFGEEIRQLDVGRLEEGPEEVGKVLGALIVGVPVLLSSKRWGGLSRSALAQSLDREELPAESLIFRTGGSSGGPKFAVHSWQTLSAAAFNLRNHLKEMPISASLNLPLFHVSGWMPVVRALLSGGCLSPVGDFGEWEKKMPGLRVASVVPTTLHRALRDSKMRDYLRGLDFVFAGGAAFSEELRQSAKREKIRLSLVYGMTETAGMIAMQDPEVFLEGAEPRLSVLQGSRVIVAESGEILVSSDQLFHRYLGGSPRTGDFWKSGDCGDLDCSGKLCVRGRLGRFATSGGETVSLERVEAAGLALPRVTEAYAVARPDKEWGERVILFLATEIAQKRDLREELRSHLDPPEVPAEIRVVARIPRNEVGKVDFDQLFR